MKSPNVKAKANIKDFQLNHTTIENDLNPDIFDDTHREDKVKEATKLSFLQKAYKGDLSKPVTRKPAVLQDFLWEYVFVFPNPDHPSQDNKSISREEASSLYKRYFKVKKTGNTQTDNLHFLKEREMFLSVFDSLKDHEDGKAFSHGGRFVVTDSSVTDSHKPAQDVLSLIRNVVFYKLVGSLGLKVKQMVSKAGEHIYFVITADEPDLEIEAERIRFNKQLEIALTDIQSLIPCDKSFRPLHVLRNNDAEIKKIFREVKPFLAMALGMEKNIDKVDYKHEPDGVTANMWNAYKIYLALLKDGIQKITSSVKSKNKQLFLFQKLIKDSIEKANTGFLKEDTLQTLWDRMGILKPIPPYAEYRRSTADDEFKDKWRTHEIDESGKRSLFRNMERLRLIVSYIETEIGVNFLQEGGFIEAHFPLHNNWQLKGKEIGAVKDVDKEDVLLRNILYDFKHNNTEGPLISCWRTALINQKIPLSKIRNYFGEKIALYFEFLRYYQVSLLVPAILGLVVFILQRIYNQDSPQVLTLNALYSLFMSIWATVFLEGWKRRESSLSILWGTTNFEKVEVPRPQYRGVTRRSPITDELEEIYYPSSKRIAIISVAVGVSLLIISLVLGIVAGLIILKSEITDKIVISGFNMVGPVISILNAVQILIFNIIYGKFARILTDLENHKTEDQYQDSYILKVFAFQFVNAFNSLCYIAFVKGYTEQCIATDSNGKAYRTSNCMNELYTQLISIFIVSYIKNLVEIGVPYFKYQKKKRVRMSNKAKIDPAMKGTKDIRDKVEAQIHLEYYLTTDHDGTIDDYMEISIQFGYLTLFALAFPLSTSLAFVGLWLEMFTDKLKIIYLIRRPVPLSARDIGTWLNIFSLTSVVAIFTNTALFCFTSKTFDDIDKLKDYTYVIFAAVVMVLLIFRNQIQTWIPDVPESYETVQARHEFVVEKLLRGEVKQALAEEDQEFFDTNMYFADYDKEIKNIDLD